MHIPLPTPFHDWREFAKEVGVIVRGALIALEERYGRCVLALPK